MSPSDEHRHTQPLTPVDRARPRRLIRIVLPAFNEESRIGTLLDRIDEAMDEAGLRYEVVVVDDGSSDRTASIVRDRSERFPILLRQHDVNKGLGTTIRDGLVVAA